MRECKWVFTDESYYESECGHAFYFIDDEHRFNEFKYCPYCSKEIHEIDEVIADD